MGGGGRSGPTTARVSAFFATFVLLRLLNVCVFKDVALAVRQGGSWGGAGGLNSVCVLKGVVLGMGWGEKRRSRARGAKHLLSCVFFFLLGSNGSPVGFCLIGKKKHVSPPPPTFLAIADTIWVAEACWGKGWSVLGMGYIRSGAVRQPE